MAPLALTLALVPMTVATAAIKVVTLDMAWASFDDQYQNCSRAMTKELPALNRSEFRQNPLFACGWTLALKEWQRRGFPLSLLSPPQTIAVLAYSMKFLYREFNEAVHTAGNSSQEYRDNFHYKTLHFLLTQALRTLRYIREPRCYNVFRGVRDRHFKAVVGQEVRFGQFASTSLSEEVAQKYGTDTVFEVRTCHGVNITDFSYDPKNLEVLIPPFEIFEVIDVTWEGGSQRIQLHSIKINSTYNCEWLQGGSKLRATGGTSGCSFQLGELLLATTALAVATRML